MDDNHTEGSPKPRSEHIDHNNANQKVGASIWRGFLALIFAIYGVVAGSAFHWREWWVVAGLMLFLFFGALALHEWLNIHTLWHCDNIFLVSVGIPMLIAIVIGFAYIITWPPERAVTFDAYIAHRPSDPPYPSNTIIGGIKFEGNLVDVRVDVTPREYSIQNLDFRVVLDGDTSLAMIFDMGIIGQYPGVSIFRPEISGMAIKIIDADGKPKIFPLDSGNTGIISAVKPVGPVWRVHCEEAFADATLRLVIMAGRFSEHPRNPDWSPTTIDVWGNFEAKGQSGTKTKHFHIKTLFIPPKPH
jgi:hypothetical protein